MVRLVFQIEAPNPATPTMTVPPTPMAAATTVGFMPGSVRARDAPLGAHGPSRPSGMAAMSSAPPRGSADASLAGHPIARALAVVVPSCSATLQLSDSRSRGAGVPVGGYNPRHETDSIYRAGQRLLA